MPRSVCGRFTLRTPAARLAQAFGGVSADYGEPRYNIAPGRPVLALRQGSGAEGARALARLRWGFVPAWAEDPSIGARLVNARAESVADKPAFRAAFRARRCLVLADGFYEWRREGRSRRPYYVRLEPDRPFAFAGLWERWMKGGPALESCTIVTTQANAVLEPIYPRMPAIVEPVDYDLWLGASPDFAEAAQDVLRPYGGVLTVHPVSTRVNEPGNDDADLIEPLEAGEEGSEVQGRLF